MSLKLNLPVVQNWSCHSCAGCCRQHLIEITSEERERILRQGWITSGELQGREPVVRLSNWPVRWRLNHTPEGACVFLTDDGLCRIHAKFGEEAKPLACRVYPYAFHPAPKGRIAVSLRYSCPSVIANRGATPQESSTEIQEIAREVVLVDPRQIPPPAISSHQRLGWNEVEGVLKHLDASFVDTETPFLRRLLAAIFWVSLLDQAKLENFTESRFEELLSLIQQAALGEVPTDLDEFDEPTRAGRLMFRLTVGQYARLETVADLDHPWRARWRNVLGISQMSRGKGLLPSFRPELKPIPFETLEQPFGWPDTADELFTRYMRTKIGGMHFCGPAFYNRPVTEGFFALALMVPISLYLARWIASGEKRTKVTNKDLQRALAMADHHHGYSPALDGRAAAQRVRILAQGDLPKLCVHYAK